MKVQISFVGNEKDRVITGVKEKKPDKAYLVVPKEGKWSEEVRSRAKDLKKNMEDFLEVQIQSLDINEPEETIDLIQRINNQNKGKISVNISGANKLNSGLVASISQFYDMEVFYINPETYEEDYPSGLQEVIELPSLNLSELVDLKEKRTILLKIVNENERISRADVLNKFQKSVEEEKGKQTYNSLLSYHMDKLERLNLVGVSRKGREVQYKITPTGRFLADIVQE